MEIWTGFIVGLVGSMHCVGMCGPIALALPVFGETRFKIIVGRLLYNLGRIITYSVMGALFGLFGSRLVLFGLQQYLSVIIGALILGYVIIPRKWKTRISEQRFYMHIVTFIKSNFSKLISKRTNRSLFTIGLLNGVLPCGFVYVGIAGAAATGNWINGAAYMALFGIGTTPIMFATAMLGKIITFDLRKKINKMVPAFTAVLALLFILRGLNLGIPYLSPKFEYQPQKTVQPEIDCCH
jgi:uncharacterized protein